MSSSKKYKNKKRMNRIKLFLALFTAVAVFSVLLFFVVILLLRNGLPPVLDLPPENSSERIMEGSPTDGPDPDTAPFSMPEEALPKETEQTEAPLQAEPASKDPVNLQETDVYTFLQGPRSWKTRVDWSGSWCKMILADQEFGAFGCGLCDLANIYGTLTPYDCSPIDMYYFAQEASGYKPVSGVGAIDWPDLKKTLKAVGISSSLKRKDKSYEKFRDAFAQGITAIVLVCSANDSTYWENVSGHYVNIWLYDPTDETVLLADSGNPEHNRQRIPLRYVYDAMKTSSRYQYLLVTSVDPDGNTWKHDGIDIRWKKPRYYSGD